MLLARSEYRVVSIARALVDRPTGPVRPLLQGAHGLPPYLSADTRLLVDEALAVGWPEVLARAGGWRRRAWAGGDRLWHRHRGVAMSFSRFALALCRYLVSAEPDTEPTLEAGPETAGDRLLCFLAARLAVRADAPELLAAPAIAGVYLVQLAFPDALARVAPGVATAAPELDDPAEALVLDGLADDLAGRLVALERDKARLADLRVASAQGRIHGGALAALDRAADARPELGAFVLDAAAALAADPPAYAEHIGPGSIAERSDARAAAAVFLSGLDRWRARAEAARAVRFFEDDYDRSQQVLRLWETLGDRRHARLAALAAELESTGAVGEIP